VPDECFEFTYELSHKMLKRYLEAASASPQEIDFSTFQNLIRSGNEKGLLRSDWSRWRDYRQPRLTFRRSSKKLDCHTTRIDTFKLE